VKENSNTNLCRLNTIES